MTRTPGVQLTLGRTNEGPQLNTRVGVHSEKETYDTKPKNKNLLLTTSRRGERRKRK